LKITVTGQGPDRKITNFVHYAATDIEQQPDTYIFQSADMDTAGGKKTVLVKLTRFESPVEATFVLAADTEWMQNRISKLRPGTPVAAAMKRLNKTVTLTDIDDARPVVRGLFVKDTDLRVDGKKQPAAIVEVNGESKTYLVPPVGQKPLPGDADVQAFVRKLKRGQAVCLSFDSERREVIRRIDNDLMYLPDPQDGICVVGAGVKIVARFNSKARVNVRIEPSPVSNADLDLAAGLRKLFRGDFNPGVTPDGKPIPDTRPQLSQQEMNEIGRLVTSFPREDEVRADARLIEQHIRQYVALNAARNNADIRKIEAALAEATIQLGIKYGPGVTDSYRQARVLLKDDAQRIESTGKLARAAGEFVR
jgi:hypothetical protein